jgi:hypothetical protein
LFENEKLYEKMKNNKFSDIREELETYLAENDLIADTIETENIIDDYESGDNFFVVSEKEYGYDVKIKPNIEKKTIYGNCLIS